MESESLRRQLENTRFDRALEVSESMAEHRLLLTTVELARLNNILMGKTDEEPWRKGPVTLNLPSGRTETMALIADPKITAREKLHAAAETAEAGNYLDAAVNIYVDLVLSHVFEDANRRTAALAAHYYLKRHGVPVSGVELHEMAVGDLRELAQVQKLREGITRLVRNAGG